MYPVGPKTQKTLFKKESNTGHLFIQKTPTFYIQIFALDQYQPYSYHHFSDLSRKNISESSFKNIQNDLLET